MVIAFMVFNALCGPIYILNLPVTLLPIKVLHPQLHALVMTDQDYPGAQR